MLFRSAGLGIEAGRLHNLSPLPSPIWFFRRVPRFPGGAGGVVLGQWSRSLQTYPRPSAPGKIFVSPRLRRLPPFLVGGRGIHQSLQGNFRSFGFARIVPSPSPAGAHDLSQVLTALPPSLPQSVRPPAFCFGGEKEDQSSGIGAEEDFLLTWPAPAIVDPSWRTGWPCRRHPARERSCQAS